MTPKKRTEKEIDQVVISQINDDDAWEQPIKIQRNKPASLILPAELTARATFLARLHHSKTVEEWLTHIIEERVELEEAAFTGARQDMASKAS